MAFAMNDYVEVADRIRAWYEQFPEGRITSVVYEFTEARVTIRAEVFRTSDPGEMPAGVGHSYMALPGSTPYTKGSELENAETSAAGRALVMAGIPSKNVASANEVRSKKAAGGSAPPAAGAAPSQAPAPPSAPPTRASGQSGTHESAGADNTAEGTVPNGKAGSCPHADTSPLKMDGKAMPTGWVRCLACNEGVKA